MACDVIIRLNLSIKHLRAQTYDGASNMSGKYNGCQAKVREQQPLALFFHCGSHLANLVMQKSINNCPSIRNALQWVQQLGVLYGKWGKYRDIFTEIANEVPGDRVLESRSRGIRPLCPTRWLPKYSATSPSLTIMQQSLRA